MNRQIRRVALVVLLAFIALLAAPLYWQVLAAPRLANDPRNTRLLVKEYAVERGGMVTGDGRVVLARSVKTTDTLKYLRQYPQGERYGMLTGFYSLVYGRTLAEQTFNDFLLGRAPEQFTQNIPALLTARSVPGGTLVLTVDPAVQQVAERELGEHKGAVVALDYTTGQVLAMTTFPRYDPNELSSHDPDKIKAYWRRLLADPDQPLLNRATQGLYPPGSTFKVVTAAAALQNGIKPTDTFPNELVYDVPQTRADIGNFGGESCASGPTITLEQAFQVSCNTTFARLGVTLGSAKLVAEAERFGLNAPMPYQLHSPRPATSSIPSHLDVPSTAQSAIGQRDVRVSPLEMATVAATVANRGVRMAPYVVRSVVATPGNSVTKNFGPLQVGQVLPPGVADQLKNMMGLVVSGGTGTSAQLPGIQVFGKTGTAQHGSEAPHAWFIGFAEANGRHIAVAVIVEDGGSLSSEATGGKVAAPIAREVMRTYLQGGQ